VPGVLAAALLGLASPDPAARPPAAPTPAVQLAVQAVAPLSGTLTTITPRFVWATTGGPPGASVVYRLRVARDPGLAQPLLDTLLTGVDSLPLARPLKPGPPVFWQVDASAGGEAATTGPTGPLAVPPWATLTSLSAPGGTITFEAQPTFTWTPAGVDVPPGPFVYELQVRRVGATFNDVAIGGLTGAQHMLTAPLERTVSYTWALVVHAGADTTLVRSAGAFLVADPSTPPATLLYQNFPNPFPGSGRDSTCLWFDLASASIVELDVLDIRGALVRRFIPGPEFPAILTAGRYGRGVISGGGVCDPRLMWDGRAANGRPLPPGVYLYRLRAGGTVQFKRIVYRGRDP
jgi:hypothetical protein